MTSVIFTRPDIFLRVIVPPFDAYTSRSSATVTGIRWWRSWRSVKSVLSFEMKTLQAESASQVFRVGTLLSKAIGRSLRFLVIAILLKKGLDCVFDDWLLSPRN